MLYTGATVIDQLPQGNYFHITAQSMNLSIKEQLKVVLYEAFTGSIMTSQHQYFYKIGGRKVMTTYGLLGDHETAVIEMVEANGIHLVKKEERNPLITSTYGTGELIKVALDQGARRIIMGIGGSAAND